MDYYVIGALIAYLIFSYTLGWKWAIDSAERFKYSRKQYLTPSLSMLIWTMAPIFTAYAVFWWVFAPVIPLFESFQKFIYRIATK